MRQTTMEHRPDQLGRRSVFDCLSCGYTLMALPKDTTKWARALKKYGCQRCGDKSQIRRVGDVVIRPWDEADEKEAKN